MNFHVVFTKNRKRFDKYSKINRIRNKVVVDIKAMLIEYDVVYEKYIDYFNLLVYTKIQHSLIKGKDIYYIPNFSNKDIDVNDVFKIKDLLGEDIKFNILMFYDEFIEEPNINEAILNNMTMFDASQILKNY